MILLSFYTQSHSLTPGEGVWTHPSGDTYAGAFENDLRHGFGRYRMGNGKEWVGDWRHGRQFQRTDHYGMQTGPVVYQSRGEAQPALSQGRVPNAVPGWESSRRAAAAAAATAAEQFGGTYDVVKKPGVTPSEGSYDVVKKPGAGQGEMYEEVLTKDQQEGYDVVVKRENSYDVVARK